MGRPKPKPPDVPLENRLAPKDDSKPNRKTKGRAAQEQYLPDGEGGKIEPIRIPEIDDAAEAYRAAKKRREKLKEAEDEARVKLKELMLAHKDELGTPPKYRYYDKKDEEIEVAIDKDPGVSVRKPKKAKATSVESHGINPGGEPVPELDDDGNPTNED